MRDSVTDQRDNDQRRASTGTRGRGRFGLSAYASGERV